MTVCTPDTIQCIQYAPCSPSLAHPSSITHHSSFLCMPTCNQFSQSAVHAYKPKNVIKMVYLASMVEHQLSSSAASFHSLLSKLQPFSRSFLSLMTISNLHKPVLFKANSHLYYFYGKCTVNKKILKFKNEGQKNNPYSSIPQSLDDSNIHKSLYIF